MTIQTSRTFMTQPLILVVDDAPDIVLFIETVLEDDYRIITAESGELALQKAELNQPDLILLDVLMPGMNGYDTCKSLKTNPKTKNITVIMVSGMDEEGDEVIGLQAGAIDYITKPISVSILLARIESQMLLLSTRKALELAHESISSERKTIEHIIDNMRSAFDFNQQHIRFSSLSAELNSGDLMLSAVKSDGTQYIMVTDFTGHGLPAAMGAPLVTYIFYKGVNDNIEPAKIITEINDTLIKILPVNIFMAATFIELSVDKTKAKLWNYGMEEILRLNHDQSWQSFPSKSYALGITNTIKTQTHYEIPFERRQSLYLLSDGVTEAADLDKNQAMFGIERLKYLLQAEALNSDFQQADNLDHILNKITEYANNPKDFDDMTLLELNITQ